MSTPSRTNQTAAHTRTRTRIGGRSKPTAPLHASDAAFAVCAAVPHRAVNGSVASRLKRFLDISLILLGSVVVVPLMLLVALCIKLDSPGPVFYNQRRVGLHGKVFWIYKFRSMHVGAEARQEHLRGKNEMTGPLFKMKHDPRMTRVGRLIRRTSLDELPQLFNVLKGEMSLVGPRPPLQSEAAQFQPWHYEKFDVLPGITGLWQVSGRSNLDFAQMMALDLEYVQTWSLKLDLRILLKTFRVVLTGDGAC